MFNPFPTVPAVCSCCRKRAHKSGAHATRTEIRVSHIFDFVLIFSEQKGNHSSISHRPARHLEWRTRAQACSREPEAGCQFRRERPDGRAFADAAHLMANRSEIRLELQQSSIMIIIGACAGGSADRGR